MTKTHRINEDTYIHRRLHESWFAYQTNRKAISHLWGWGELNVVAAQNIDYSSAQEIEERIAKAIEDGLELCKTF